MSMNIVHSSAWLRTFTVTVDPGQVSLIYKAQQVASMEEARELRDICDLYLSEMDDRKINSLNELMNSGALEPTHIERVEHAERQLHYHSGRRPTCVYLMLNHRNGYYKIGRSRRPEIREKTLQSEEPEIEMVGCWDGLERHEDILHGWFREKRIRGEWFALTSKDVARIEKFFANLKE